MDQTPHSSFVNNANTKHLFEQFANQFESILQCKVNLCFNIETNYANITYTSQTDPSLLNLWIYDVNHGYVKNTLIPHDRPLMKISYVEVNPKGRGIGSQLFKALVTTLHNTPINRIVVIPESEEALHFWLKHKFIPWMGDNNQLYLDITK